MGICASSRKNVIISNNNLSDMLKVELVKPKSINQKFLSNTNNEESLIKKSQVYLNSKNISKLFKAVINLFKKALLDKVYENIAFYKPVNKINLLRKLFYYNNNLSIKNTLNKKIKLNTSVFKILSNYHNAKIFEVYKKYNIIYTDKKNKYSKLNITHKEDRLSYSKKLEKTFNNTNFNNDSKKNFNDENVSLFTDLDQNLFSFKKANSTFKNRCKIIDTNNNTISKNNKYSTAGLSKYTNRSKSVSHKSTFQNINSISNSEYFCSFTLLNKDIVSNFFYDDKFIYNFNISNYYQFHLNNKKLCEYNNTNDNLSCSFFEKNRFYNLINKYMIDKAYTIASGAFSNVYSGYNEENNTLYAVKVIEKLDSLPRKIINQMLIDPKIIIENEIKTLKRIKTFENNFIVKVYDILEVDDCAFIVMEKMDTSLYNLISNYFIVNKTLSGNNIKHNNLNGNSVNNSCLDLKPKNYKSNDKLFDINKKVTNKTINNILDIHLNNKTFYEKKHRDKYSLLEYKNNANSNNNFSEENNQNINKNVENPNTTKSSKYDSGKISNKNSSINSKFKNSNISNNFNLKNIKNIQNKSIVFNTIGRDFKLWHIIRSLILAVDYCHNYLNIVHGDIHPKNILVSNDLFNVKLSDFGLSSIEEDCYKTKDLENMFNFNEKIKKKNDKKNRINGYKIPPELLEVFNKKNTTSKLNLTTASEYNNMSNNKTLQNNNSNIETNFFNYHNLINELSTFKSKKCIDVWMIGVTIYWIFKGNINDFDNNPNETYKYYKNKNSLKIIKDRKLRSLVKKMLSFDPKLRPRIRDIKKDPYITKNGKYPLHNIYNNHINNC